MKNLLWILLLISCQCYGQRDICSGIAQEENKPESQLIYHAPLVGKTAILGVSKVIEDTTSSFPIYAAIILNEAPAGGRGIQLKLADGTIIRDEESTLKITTVDLGKVNFSGSFEAEESNMELLGSVRVVAVSCGGVERQVSEKEADLFMAYVRCLLDR